MLIWLGYLSKWIHIGRLTQFSAIRERPGPFGMTE